MEYEILNGNVYVMRFYLTEGYTHGRTHVYTLEHLISMNRAIFINCSSRALLLRFRKILQDRHPRQNTQMAVDKEAVVLVKVQQRYL